MTNILIDDGLQIEQGTGIGRYTCALVEALAKRQDISVKLTRWNTTRTGLRKRIEYLAHINSTDYIRELSKYDLVIYTNYVMPIRKIPVKTTVIIHDLASFDVPETLPVLYRYYNRFAITYALKNADRVVTVSKTMRDAIVDKYPSFRDKIRWAWPGILRRTQADDCNTQRKESILEGRQNRPFFLFVSTVEKRKNVELVIKAFDRLKETTHMAATYWLSIVGRPGYGFNEIKELADSLASRKDIVFTGYISDSDCVRLYNEAAAFVFPTKYEGFGFAQTECMSYGLPIILSDIPINREISREYGIYFDISSIESLTIAMRSVVEDKINRNEIIAKANNYLRDFSWDNVVDACIKDLRSVSEAIL